MLGEKRGRLLDWEYVRRRWKATGRKKGLANVIERVPGAPRPSSAEPSSEITRVNRDNRNGGKGKRGPCSSGSSSLIHYITSGLCSPCVFAEG